LEDVAYFINRWLEAGCNPANNYCGGTDTNNDGKVDLVDWSILAAHWMKGVIR